MFHHRWSDIFMKIIVITGFIFVFSGCAKQPAKTAVVEQPSDVKQEGVMEKKADDQFAVAQQQAAPEKLVMAEEKRVAEAPPLVERQAAVEQKEEAKDPVKKKAELQAQHIVRKGDSLWWIAKYKDQYNDPYLWPLIYEANKKILRNPDLIYPGQKITIPRAGYNLDAIKKARKKAGAPKPYQAPKDANLPVN
jgi:nucleoid-associated protein YgaU